MRRKEAVGVAVLDEDAAEFVRLLAAEGVAADGFGHPEDLLAAGGRVEVLLANPAAAARVVGELPDLRWIQSTWAGVDALIGAPLPAGVVVTGVRGVFDAQMREFVFGHLLAHSQRVVERSLARTWDGTPAPVLAGSTIGILGTGSVGGAIAATARHLGMSVRGCNRGGGPAEPFDSVWPVSDRMTFADGLDHLVAALPSTGRTRRLVDAELLGRLSPGATFVNVGRGSTADVQAVVDALDGGTLSLAVLDVLPVEPLADGDPLWDVPGLVITSHTAAWSRPPDIARLFLENHGRYLAGAPLRHVIDMEEGY
jgi:phosphoglycerate dehydrogenase-like enzyme